MTTTIEEVRIGNGRCFRVNDYNKDNKLLKSRTIKLSVKSTVINKVNYYILFDSNNEVIKEVFQYINLYKQHLSSSSREKTCLYLKQLYEFAGVIDKDISKFVRSDIDKLICFLKGNDLRNSFSNKLYMYSRKSDETVAVIFNAIRDFVSFCQYSSYRYFKHYRIRKGNLKNSRAANNQCPKFISLREMKLITDYVRNDSSLDEETRKKYNLIYKLMYNKGLRVGEVLGLTLEDFEEYYDTNGNLIYKVYIRNRYSDNHDQHAKRCLSMDGHYTYNSPAYHRFNIGYQLVFINQEMYEDIIEYVDISTARFNRANKTVNKADSISGTQNNWYVFLNRKTPTPLSKDVLALYTRKMFTDLNIHIDTVVRTNNLFHRFRHGYCMYLLYVEKMNPMEACALTRHRSTNSLSAYNNPTEEMLAEMMIQIEEGIAYGNEYN